jgi:hypothetical protein
VISPLSIFITHAILISKGGEYMDLYLLDKKSFSYLEQFYQRNLSPQQLSGITGLSAYNMALELSYLLQLNFITNTDGFHSDSEGILSNNTYEITPSGRSYYEAVLEQRKIDKHATCRSNLALFLSFIAVIISIFK